jgi:hypothetical protein
MTSRHKALGTAIATIGIVTMFARVAPAADASAWSEDNHAAFRLIAGSNKADAPTLRAGVEIKLGPGWHTYWRYPGDSGVPPRFDFSQSENVAAVTVAYPAPHLLTDESNNSLVYTKGVIFPLRVKPKQTGKPVKLAVKLDYAVCEKICVPAQGSAELTLIMVDLKVPPGKPVAIFVEGPTPEWALPIPRPAPGGEEGHRQFGFELDGLPPGVDPKGHFDLTFTVVEGDQAYEIKSRLD